jgi:hypothetical protein
MYLRWCISRVHSGFPFQFDIPETTTVGSLCQMVKDRNLEWCYSGHSEKPFNVVKICGNNETFLDENMQIGPAHHNGESFYVFRAG